MMQPNQKKTAIQLISLFMVFALPALMSWFLYHYHARFSLKTVNYGVLMHPPVLIQDLVIPERKWQIVYAPGACRDTKSEKMMYTLHQVQKALGKDRDRVSLTLVESGTCAPQNAHDFRRVLTNTQLAQLQSVSAARNQNKIYLVDPIGNAFMYYRADTNPMYILKDLKHVLGVSQIG